MPRVRSLALAALVTLATVTCAACSNANPETNGSPRACQLDADCGDRAYCTQAHVCRTDCFTDVECLGPSTTVQCTSHGQCIDTTGDTGVVADAPDEDATSDAKPTDAIADAKDGGAGEGGP